MSSMVDLPQFGIAIRTVGLRTNGAALVTTMPSSLNSAAIGRSWSFMLTAQFSRSILML